MFPIAYFVSAYFAPRYFPKSGEESAQGEPVRITAAVSTLGYSRAVTTSNRYTKTVEKD